MEIQNITSSWPPPHPRTLFKENNDKLGNTHFYPGNSWYRNIIFRAILKKEKEYSFLILYLQIQIKSADYMPARPALHGCLPYVSHACLLDLVSCNFFSTQSEAHNEGNIAHITHHVQSRHVMILCVNVIPAHQS